MGFVATKKMKLLSGNPDGFALVFDFLSTKEKGNRLTIQLPSLSCSLIELCQQPVNTRVNLQVALLFSLPSFNSLKSLV